MMNDAVPEIRSKKDDNDTIMYGWHNAGKVKFMINWSVSTAKFARWRANKDGSLMTVKHFGIVKVINLEFNLKFSILSQASYLPAVALMKLKVWQLF